MKKEFELLEKIKNEYRKILKSNLVGIYIHGSIAFGCFNFEKSDIDFIVIINNEINEEDKKRLIDCLLQLKGVPPKGFEMSLILKRYCKTFQYPTPFELHYSIFHKDDPYKFCDGQIRKDYDLAAHFMTIKQVGLKLYGLPISDVFGAIDENDYFDSIKRDIQNAREEIKDHPVYMILNLCRVLAFKKENLFLSKSQGGHWGLNHLPKKYHPIIISALSTYEKNQEFKFDDNLYEYCDFLLTEINKKLSL